MSPSVGQLGDIDFDALVLRTLIIDGEVFIRVDKKTKNPYGISFELIDSLQIDTTKNQNKTASQNAIVMGVEIDHYNRPIKYFFREASVDNYQTGRLVEVPADEMIHIYKHEFIGQTRGFGDIVASIDSLKQLDDYAIAELFAAKVAACQGIFYERNGSTQAGDMIDANTEEEDKGVFISELSPRRSLYCASGIHRQIRCPHTSEYEFQQFRKGHCQKNRLIGWSKL